MHDMQHCALLFTKMVNLFGTFCLKRTSALQKMFTKWHKFHSYKSKLQKHYMLKNYLFEYWKLIGSYI